MPLIVPAPAPLLPERQAIFDRVRGELAARPCQPLYLDTTAVDLSKGCDQFVFCAAVSTRQGEEVSARGSDDSLPPCSDFVVIKYPKEEVDKVDKQCIMAQLAAGPSPLSQLSSVPSRSFHHRFNASTILHRAADYLVESFIPGNSLSLEMHGDDARVWQGLGRQMRCLHACPGAYGYSNRCAGEANTHKFPIFASYESKMHAELAGGGDIATEVEGVEAYLASMLKKHACEVRDLGSVDCESETVGALPRTCWLHYDVSFDNVIVTPPAAAAPVVTLIDFADAGMGDWREDFATLYCELHDEAPQQWRWLLEGYSSGESGVAVTENDVRWMGFFCVVRLTWALADVEKNPTKRATQLRLVKRVVAEEIEPVVKGRI